MVLRLGRSSWVLALEQVIRLLELGIPITEDGIEYVACIMANATG